MNSPCLSRNGAAALTFVNGARAPAASLPAVPSHLPFESSPAKPLPLDPRALCSLDTLSARDVEALLQAARRIQRAARVGAPPRSLHGRNIARLGRADGADDGAFDRAASELGAQVTHVGAHGPGLASSAGLQRTARMLGRLYDAIDCAGLPQPHFEGLVREAGVPVFNGLASRNHPLRMLAVVVELQALAGHDPRGLRVALCADPASPLCLALQRLAALAGVDLHRELDGAEFVIEADGRVRRHDGAVSAGDDAQRYALQALLISTIV